MICWEETTFPTTVARTRFSHTQKSPPGGPDPQVQTRPIELLEDSGEAKLCDLRFAKSFLIRHVNLSLHCQLDYIYKQLKHKPLVTHFLVQIIWSRKSPSDGASQTKGNRRKLCPLPAGSHSHQQVHLVCCCGTPPSSIRTASSESQCGLKAPWEFSRTTASNWDCCDIQPHELGSYWILGLSTVRQPFFYCLGQICKST